MHITRRKFEQLVHSITADMQRALPPELRDKTQRVIVGIADRPSREQYGQVENNDDDLLGLYEGTPLPERHIDDLFILPDQITLFRMPLMDLCANEAELREEIRLTLIHELGHYFGFEEDDLEKLGVR
jgi:predicted Zn-dependent protease with MMP-like domain